MADRSFVAHSLVLVSLRRFAPNGLFVGFLNWIGECGRNYENRRAWRIKAVSKIDI